MSSTGCKRRQFVITAKILTKLLKKKKKRFLHSLYFCLPSSRLSLRPVNLHTGCKSCVKLANTESKQVVKN